MILWLRANDLAPHSTNQVPRGLVLRKGTKQVCPTDWVPTPTQSTLLRRAWSLLKKARRTNLQHPSVPQASSIWLPTIVAGMLRVQDVQGSEAARETGVADQCSFRRPFHDPPTAGNAMRSMQPPITEVNAQVMDAHNLIRTTLGRACYVKLCLPIQWLQLRQTSFTKCSFLALERRSPAHSF
mmetsp:Transcript_13132/g.48726  ORF Transcript_13132/g.48726 Transcript_13132/m.48726 type:complete len:183 (-) Transcript_13132:130-678(-)